MSLLDTASLIVTPNGYKEGKLYSVIPSDGSGDMSVTRATTATRVNSAGLVELVPYNLLNYSQSFDNAAWVKSNATISANTIASPSGIQDADSIIENTATGIHIFYQGPIAASSGIYTTSMFFKKNTRQYAFLQIAVNGAADRFTAVIDLNNGNVTDTTTVGSPTSTSYTTEDFGNGWYRLTVSAQHNSGNVFLVSGLSDSATPTYNVTGEPNYTGNGTGSVYAWGAQLVEGSTALPYQKTETRLNIPRLDYSNGTCPSLLVEPQRTNFITYSEDVNSCFPSKSNTTVTSNSTTSPDGTINADLVAFTGANAYVLRGQTVNATTTYTMSVFVKNNNFASGENLIFNMSDGIIGGLKANIDVFNKTATFSGAGGAYTNISGKVEDYGNGWFRVICTGTSIAGGGGWYEIATAGITRSCYLWGMSLEVGSYATSYIPTTSASVTRNADVISKTGISSLIGQTEGSVFWDINVDILSASGHEDILNIDNGAFGNTIYLAKLSNATFGAEVYNANVQQFGVFSIPIPAVGRYKLALAYNTNDFAFYVNGVLVGSDTSGSVGAMSRIQLGQTVFGPSTGYTNAAAIWKTRLTNTQLAALTTI